MLKRPLRQAPTPPGLSLPAAPRSSAAARPDAWWLWLSALPRAGRIEPAPGAHRGSRP